MKRLTSTKISLSFKTMRSNDLLHCNCDCSSMSPEWPSDGLNNSPQWGWGGLQDQMVFRCCPKRPPSMPWMTSVQLPAITPIAMKCSESVVLGHLISRPTCFGDSPICLQGPSGPERKSLHQHLSAVFSVCFIVFLGHGLDFVQQVVEIE